MNKVTKENAHEVVRYHPPTEEQKQAHEAVAVVAETMIRAILEVVPECADRTSAIRHVRVAKMEASAAIALNGMI